MQLVISEDKLIQVPDNWSDAEAGGFMETTVTAYLNIFELGEMQHPKTGEVKQGAVRIHGGGSGIGTQTIRLCKAKNIKVFVTAGRCELRALWIGPKCLSDACCKHSHSTESSNLTQATMKQRGECITLIWMAAPVATAQLRCHSVTHS